MRTFIWLLIACFSLLYACDEELKNKSREDIEQCVPKGEKTVVISKYTNSPYGQLRHFIKSSLTDGSSCVDMVTRFDYKIIQVGDTVSRSTSITLEWSSSDIDNDIIGYDVYFGEENPPVNNIGTVSNTSININLTSGNVYYWLVKTMDGTENISDSDIFWFKIN